MWKCSKCKENIEDEFDSCWSCGFSRDGSSPSSSEKNKILTTKKEMHEIEQSEKKLKTQKRQEVVVVDVEMPLGSMIVFMVKWAIASIPAFIILFLIGMFIFRVISA